MLVLSLVAFYMPYHRCILGCLRRTHGGGRACEARMTVSLRARWPSVSVFWSSSSGRATALIACCAGATCLTATAGLEDPAANPLEVHALRRHYADITGTRTVLTMVDEGELVKHI